MSQFFFVVVEKRPTLVLLHDQILRLDMSQRVGVRAPGQKGPDQCSWEDGPGFQQKQGNNL